jgi:hypothetical protein
LSAPPPIPSSPILSLEELHNLLPIRPAAIVLGPAIASSLSGRSVVLKDLLQSGLRLAFDNIGINEKLKQQVLANLDNFDLLRRMRVGSLLESFSKSKKGLRADWLREAIGPPSVANPAVAAPLLNAAQSGFALASATYDGLLEMASGLKSLTWLEFHGLSQLLNPPTLLRLYGAWDQPESIVRALPGASGAELHRRAIDTFLNDLQLLVTLGAAVPFGEDPLVEGLKRQGKNLPGVVVCRDDEVEAAQAFLAEHLPWFRIAPYSGGNEALPEVLTSLFGTARLPGTPALESTPPTATSAPRAPRILVQDAGSEVLDLAYAASGDWIIAAQGGRQVSVLHSSGDTRRSSRYTAIFPGSAFKCAATHKHFQIAAAAADSGSIFWTSIPPKKSNIWPSAELGDSGGNPAVSLCFHPVTGDLVVGRESGQIDWWTPPSPLPDWALSEKPFKHWHSTHAHPQGALAVAFSPDGQTLASAGHDRAIRFWSVPGLKPLRVLEGHEDWVGSIAYSPNGKTLASTGGDKTVILWDLEAGQPLWRARGHTQEIRRLSFHPSGQLIATGSWDKTVRLWDATNGRPLKTFEGHTERVWTVAFSPDGTWLASGGDDRTIRLWPIDVAELKASAPRAKEPLPPDFLELAHPGERFARFLARLTLRHREGLPLLETLEPGCLADALRPANVLAATSPADFAERTLALEKNLDPTFEPPPLWLAWMQHVRGAEIARLGQELLTLAKRAVEASHPASPAASPASPEVQSEKSGQPSLESNALRPMHGPLASQEPPTKAPRRKTQGIKGKPHPKQAKEPGPSGEGYYA